MTQEDRRRWDGRYASIGRASMRGSELPDVFEPYEPLFPLNGSAIDIACGAGQAAVWLARRGLTVWGLDVSPVAVGLAHTLAAAEGVDHRCRFDVVDLDDGLPDGGPVNLVLCHRFRDARLDGAIIDRLAPGGMVAIAVLSEVDAGPGPFRVRPGELVAAFADLDVVAAGEGRGEAWLIARRDVIGKSYSL